MYCVPFLLYSRSDSMFTFLNVLCRCRCVTVPLPCYAMYIQIIAYLCVPVNNTNNCIFVNNNAVYLRHIALNNSSLTQYSIT